MTRVPTSPAERQRWAGTSGHAAGWPVPAGGAAARAGRLNGVAGSRQSLSRTVTVRVFTPGSGHVPRVMEDTRAACRISDSRLGQIFDADDRAEPPFIVTQWPYGTHVTDLLSHGPLDPCHAARVIAEAADALSAAHNGGLAHRARMPCRARNAGPAARPPGRAHMAAAPSNAVADAAEGAPASRPGPLAAPARRPSGQPTATCMPVLTGRPHDRVFGPCTGVPGVRIVRS